MAKQTQSEETPFNFTRFDGGYFTNLSDAEMLDNEMLTAENCEWDGGLRKRRGIQVYSTVTASITIRGAIRAYIAGAWRTFVAKDLGSSMVIHHQATASAAWASVNMPSASAFTLTTGVDTQFAVIGERVVGVNGSDEPWLIYYDGASICADTIERYDTRTRTDDDWTAGQLSSAGGTYTDDTEDAQNSDADDFYMFGATVSTGFFIGCNYTFNKLVLTNVSVPGAAVPWVFQYYGYNDWASYRAASATWITISTASMIQTTDWATTTNTLNLEWPVPFISDGYNYAPAWQNAKTGDMGSADTFLGGKYAVRGYTATTTATGAVCDLIKVQHSQYLSELLLDDKPDTVALHKNQIFLGMGNWFRMSGVDSPLGDALRDWPYDAYQGMRGGGTIKCMVTHGDYLAILQEDQLFGVLGNAWGNFSYRKLADHGCVSKRGAAVVGQNLYYIGEDGLWQWDGKTQTGITRGIKDDIDTWTLTNAALTEYQGELWMSLPTNSTVIKADPDTFRVDNHGHGRLSFYKFTNYRVDGWLYCKGDSDLGYLLGYANNTTPIIARCDYDTVDFITSTASIDFVFRSKNMTLIEENAVKQYRRFKPVLGDMASAATATDTKCLYQFQFINKDNYGSTTANATVTVSACSSGIFEADLTIPHTMDGKRLSIYMRHSATSTAKLYGFSIGARRRWF